MELKEREIIGDYLVGKTLGEGNFGKVKLGTHIAKGKKVALKFIQHNFRATAREIEVVSREIKILKLLKHPNIVQLLEVIEMPEKKTTVLVLELIEGGDMLNYINGKGGISEDEAIHLFRQIISAVEYTHSNLVVHRGTYIT